MTGQMSWVVTMSNSTQHLIVESKNLSAAIELLAFTILGVG